MRIRFDAPATILYFLLCVIATVSGMLLGTNAILAAHGPPRLTLDYAIELLGSPLAHGDLVHLFSNFAFLLLLGPVLEERFGPKRVFMMFVLTGAVVAALHGWLFTGGLIGASGIVFMAIMLVSISSARRGGIPLTVILIGVLFLGKEIMAVFTPDTISQFAHLAGGVLGILFGLAYRKDRG